MAIQHSKSIESLQVLNSGSNDIVSKVRVIFTSYDDSDQAGTTIESHERFDINTDGVSNTDSGFVAFADLTESTIFGWISNLSDMETRFQTNHTSWINSVLNPPTPPTVNRANPW
jgi:hypothetical protein|tara:strand:+ start:171 stop:515 length:345 start_codon:yes stop_codon:yes gene_type:complete